MTLGTDAASHGQTPADRRRSHLVNRWNGRRICSGRLSLKGGAAVTGFRKLRLAGVVLIIAAVLAACVPGQGPQLRMLHGQVWGSSFIVQVQPFGRTTLDLPVRLELAFSQRLTQVSADASLAYDLAIFRLNTGELELSGRLGLDDSLDLSNSDGLLQFDGRFQGEQLRGTVSIAGLVPVGDVVFTRIR